MRLTISLLFIFSLTSIYSQDEWCRDSIVGVFSRSDITKISEKEYISFKFFNKGRFYGVTYYPNESEEIFYSNGIQNFGFYPKVENMHPWGYERYIRESEIDPLSILLDCGEWFVTYSTDSKSKFHFGVSSHFDYGGDVIDLESDHRNWYIRIEKIPYEVMEYLNSKGEEDNINYFEEFLNKTFRSVCTPQVDIFDVLDGQSIGYLVQGDLVEVLEESGDWVKVEYLKTNVEYWTYQSCLE